MTIEPPDSVRLTDDLTISRIMTGLWQVADMERNGTDLDPDKAADHLADYAESGFDTFDMADHYGSAEIIASRLLQRRPDALAFTKWCPPPGPMSPETVRAGVQERLDRLGAARIDLLQFHWWSFEHPAWLDALHELATLREEGLIREIGVTNFDAAHLHLALADGVPVRTNQVVCSLLDRRFTGPLAVTCARHGVHLLAYGTVCGGFLSERWLGQPEPENIPDWSKMKYRRFIEYAGGWETYQAVLSAAAEIGGEARCLGDERGNALGPGTVTCRQRHHRSPAGRRRSPRRQRAALRVFPRRRGPRGPGPGLRRHHRDPRRLR